MLHQRSPAHRDVRLARPAPFESGQPPSALAAHGPKCPPPPRPTAAQQFYWCISFCSYFLSFMQLTLKKLAVGVLVLIHVSFRVIRKSKGKGQVHPRTVHAGPERE